MWSEFVGGVFALGVKLGKSLICNLREDLNTEMYIVTKGSIHSIDHFFMYIIHSMFVMNVWLKLVVVACSFWATRYISLGLTTNKLHI